MTQQKIVVCLCLSILLSAAYLLICCPAPCCPDADEYSDTARLLLCCWSSASCFPAACTNTAASCAALVRCLGSLVGPALGHFHDSPVRSREHERRGTTDKKLPSVHTSAVCAVCAALTQGHCTTVQLYHCTTVHTRLCNSAQIMFIPHISSLTSVFVMEL